MGFNINLLNHFVSVTPLKSENTLQHVFFKMVTMKLEKTGVTDFEQAKISN